VIIPGIRSFAFNLHTHVENGSATAHALHSFLSFVASNLAGYIDTHTHTHVRAGLETMTTTFVFAQFAHVHAGRMTDQ
jgi:hypothetical protein